MDSDEFIEFKGTHGTAQSNADQILRSNFRPQDGRFGFAVYIWHSGAYSVELAHSWHKFRKETGSYNRLPNQDCAILEVTGEVTESQFLNLEDREVRDIIEENIKRAPGKPKNVITRFIEDYGKKIGHRVSLIRGQQPPAKGFTVYCPRYDYKYLGNPIVLAIMDVRLIKRTSQIEA